MFLKLLTAVDIATKFCAWQDSTCAKFAAIGLSQYGWEQNQLPIASELWWKIVSETGPSLSCSHYSVVIMGALRSQITNATSVYSTVYSGADQRKYQSSASLAFVWEIRRWPVNSPHKWQVTLKMFPFDDIFMELWHFTWFILFPKCKNTQPYAV